MKEELINLIPEDLDNRNEIVQAIEDSKDNTEIAAVFFKLLQSTYGFNRDTWDSWLISAEQIVASNKVVD